MKPRVLVVDDDAENCRALSELLTVEGFDPVAFERAEAAWLAMEQMEVRPDIVVADVRMPGLDGVALLRRIKARFPAVPVVLVSAFPDERVWSEGLRVGATDVFPKPIHGASLVRALRETVGGSRPQELPVG
jgi:DNA-binding response OmpR family regulator